MLNQLTINKYYNGTVEEIYTVALPRGGISNSELLLRCSELKLNLDEKLNLTKPPRGSVMRLGRQATVCIKKI